MSSRKQASPRQRTDVPPAPAPIGTAPPLPPGPKPTSWPWYQCKGCDYGLPRNSFGPDMYCERCKAHPTVLHDGLLSMEPETAADAMHATACDAACHVPSNTCTYCGRGLSNRYLEVNSCIDDEERFGPLYCNVVCLMMHSNLAQTYMDEEDEKQMEEEQA